MIYSLLRMPAISQLDHTLAPLPVKTCPGDISSAFGRQL